MTSRHERLGYGSTVLGLLTILFPASTAKVGTAQVARTWQEARVFFPGSAVPVNPAKVPARDDPLPTVLYRTGCTGFDYSHDGTMGGWAQTLTSASYAVVMPTSFAREHRPHACEQSTYTYHAELADEVFGMRRDEIEYALAQLRTLSWVDQRNIFLMGHSEGGAAVARWAAQGFSGHIISGWTCTHRYDTSFDGIKAPLETPVLAVGFETDPWFQGELAGSCASKFGGRKDARQMTLPGSGHNTASYAEARKAVLQFLRSHTIR